MVHYNISMTFFMFSCMVYQVMLYIYVLAPQSKVKMFICYLWPLVLVEQVECGRWLMRLPLATAWLTVGEFRLTRQLLIWLPLPVTCVTCVIANYSVNVMGILCTAMAPAHTDTSKERTGLEPILSFGCTCTLSWPSSCLSIPVFQAVQNLCVHRVHGQYKYLFTMFSIVYC